MIKGLPFRYSLSQKRIGVKIIVALLLVVFSILLTRLNRDILSENKRMTRFIGNEEKIKGNYSLLSAEKKRVEPFILALKKDEDLEKISGDYLNLLLGLVEQSNLEVDSYRSGRSEEEGFRVFTYDIKLMGPYPQVLVFLQQLGTNHKFFYTRRLEVKKRDARWVTVDAGFDILAREK